VHGVGVWREIREKFAAAARAARGRKKSVLAACAILDACVALCFPQML
jgi:hypothetical protein